MQLAGRPDDVRADDRLVRVDEDVGQLALVAAALKASFTSSGVTSRARMPVKSVMEPSWTGTRRAEPSSRPFMWVQHQAGGPGRTRARGHDVVGRRPGPAVVLVHEVEQVLVVGVGVHRRHQAFFDAEGVVEDLDHGHEAVGRAAGVGDDAVNRPGRRCRR